MNSVLLAALAIGGTTLIGAFCGFLFDRIGDVGNRRVTAFAAGVMLAAATLGLFGPAVEMCEGAAVLLPALGAVCGVLFLKLADRLSGKIRCGSLLKEHPELMFVLAIAVHKFPEGMAGGVGLGSLNPGAAATVVTGIALQNLPEGAVMIPPLLSADVSRSKAACIAVATGLLNAAGVAAGALWGYLPGGVMPLALGFAGGAMLFVILSGMLEEKNSTWITMTGFLIMHCVNGLF